MNAEPTTAALSAQSVDPTYFAVIREAGPGWAAGTGVAAQPALGDHAAFHGHAR